MVNPGIAPILNPDELAVSFESDVFDEHPEAAFMVARVAVPGEVEWAKADDAVAEFRANVYVDEMGFLPENARDNDGKETDQDDDHSVRFGVIENRLDQNPRVVGASRLIVKHEVEQPLPVEREFPDVYSHGLPVGATEVSRFIARHEDRDMQRMVALTSIRSVLMEAADRESPEIHAIVEEHLARYLGMIGIPFDRMSDARELSDYGNTKNLAVRFIPETVIAKADDPDMANTPFAKFFNPDTRSDSGVGFYDSTLQKRGF